MYIGFYMNVYTCVNLFFLNRYSSLKFGTWQDLSQLYKMDKFDEAKSDKLFKFDGNVVCKC